MSPLSWILWHKKWDDHEGSEAGRPRRTDNPTRLVVHVPGKLKRRLRVHAALVDRDMGGIVTEALVMWLKRKGRKHGTR
jgi:hypothetical protein